jgi:putative nucleotidyltransferase with HDIG domain
VAGAALKEAEKRDRFGRSDDAVDLYDRALKEARRKGDERAEADFLRKVGEIKRKRGDAVAALRLFRSSQYLFQKIGDQKSLSYLYNHIGMGYRDRRLWKEARKYFEKSYQKSRELDDLELMGIASLNLAMVEIRLNQLEKAEDYCERAYSIFENLDDKPAIAESYICFGMIHRQKKEHRRSERYFKKCVELNREIDNTFGLAEAYRELALLYQDQGNSKLVFQYLGDSLETFRELQASCCADDIDEKIRELEEIYIRIAREMGEEAESSDTYTFGHSRRVAHYAALLADEAGLSDPDKNAIRVAAYLHDLGKVKIPREILKKPKKFTPVEYLTIMKHPAWSVELLESIEFPWDVKPLILHHQERFDGKGYPEGLAGEDIPLSVRIISIADFFDTMTTDRPYRKALNVDETLSIMDREKGKILDPELLEIFEPMIRKHFPMEISPEGESEIGDMEDTRNGVSKDR